MSLSVLVLIGRTADGATLTVNAGGNLQAALNAAQPGDVILLEAGATFSGKPAGRPAASERSRDAPTPRDPA